MAQPRKTPLSLKKGDLWLLAGGLLLALCAWLLLREGRPAGAYAVVEQNGQQTGRYDLLVDQTLPLQGPYGYNLLVIEGGKAYIREADCPHGLCMRRGPVSRVGESLVCLPHRLLVRIVGPGPALDGVSG